MAFTKVSIVEIVKASPKITTKKDNKTVSCLSNKEKKQKSI